MSRSLGRCAQRRRPPSFAPPRRRNPFPRRMRISSSSRTSWRCRCVPGSTPTCGTTSSRRSRCLDARGSIPNPSTLCLRRPRQRRVSRRISSKRRRLWSRSRSRLASTRSSSSAGTSHTWRSSGFRCGRPWRADRGGRAGHPCRRRRSAEPITHVPSSSTGCPGTARRFGRTRGLTCALGPTQRTRHVSRFQAGPTQRSRDGATHAWRSKVRSHIAQLRLSAPPDSDAPLVAFPRNRADQPAPPT
mmetsp:Transcript_108752/g.314014  ORF Transcript_108752/g.314014 Transcript_108752/m.314014 type:complete len:245 (-) Transcript_108752:26-760(-)